MGNWVKAASASDVAEGDVLGVTVGGQAIALYRLGGRFHATGDICSHAYARLSDGYLDADDCTIECPLHAARFAVLTGAALEEPASEPIKVYPVKLDGDDLLVALD